MIWTVSSQVADPKAPSKTSKRVWSIVVGALLCLFIAISACPLVAGLFGVELLAVRSGSMEPGIQTGAMVVVTEASETQKQNFSAGSVVTFEQPGTPGRLVTHRINSVDHADGATTYVTKGDANGITDPWVVDASAVVGSPMASVDYAGYVYVFLSSWPVRFAVVTLVVGVAWMPRIENVSDDESAKEVVDIPA